MKKFFMYVVVLVTLLFIGYTVYYFVQNNETISCTLGEENQIFINVGETNDLPILWTKPYSSTKVYDEENVEISDKEVVSYDYITRTLFAKAGGSATVTITPSNKKFGPFIFTVVVGDGTVNFPYYIQNDLELTSIGKTGSKFTLNDSYKLTREIDLKSYSNWEPIGDSVNPFAGNFDGNNRAISNLTITSGDSVGLFGEVSSTSNITNVILNKPSIKGSFENAGAISGVSRGSIRLCRVVDLTLENVADNSNNGGICGYCSNLSTNNEFTSFAYVDMCNVTVSAKSAGNFGGIVGRLVGSVIYNSKCVISNYTTIDNTVNYGSIAGVMEQAAETTAYMFSVIKNNLSVINSLTITNTTANIGVVVGQNIDSSDTTNPYQNIIKNIYFTSIVDGLNFVGTSNRTRNDNANVFSKSSEDLLKQETFNGWDFEFVWTTYEDSAIVDINYETAVAQTLDEYIPGQEITTAIELSNVLIALRNNPSKTTVYEVSANIELDLGNAEWSTIAPNASNPLKGSIICKNDSTVVIKNFKLSGNNSSFFGYISGVNTKISGITFENVTQNAETEYCGVIATIIQDNANLEKCKVNNFTITTGQNTKYIGVIAGSNSGKIVNCAVNENAEELNTITVEGKRTAIAGIAGENRVLISSSTVSSVSVIVPNDTDVLCYFGSISGWVSGGTIKNCYAYDCKFQNDCLGTIYVGGVAAFITDSTIEKSFCDNGYLSVPYTNNKTYVGGVVGFTSGSVVKTSYYEGVVSGYFIGGIAGLNTSTIDQCYFKGELVGMQIGGLVSLLNAGTVTNCSTQGVIIGKSNNSTASGLVAVLPEGTLVEHCFCNLDFGACEGTTTYAVNAETTSEFRVSEFEKIMNDVFGGWLIPELYTESTGELKNCIIINYGKAEIKTGMAKEKGKFIECSDAEAKGLSGDYAPFKNSANFDQTIWLFDNNNGEGAYPTLRNVVKNPKLSA